MLKDLLAASDPFPPIQPPPGVVSFGGGQIGGVPILVSIILKTLILIAGVYSIFNFILAGYWYISGAADPKRLHDATGKIWQTVMGLAVAAGAFIIAGVVSQIIYGDPTTLLKIQIFTPTGTL